MLLKAIGVTDPELENIQAEQLGQVGFTEKEILLIGLARASNSNPQRIPESRFEKLRGVGATDNEIVEALGVMEIFTSFNKFIDALEIALDF